MRVAVVLLCVALAACGRIGFDAGELAPPSDAAEPCTASPNCVALECQGACYQFCEVAASWDAAQASCVAWNGCLASIESLAELSCFSMLTTTNWIGLRQVNGGAEPAGGWEWVCRGPVVETNWASGEPNDQQQSEDCGNIRVDSTWNDGDCPAALPYVCERP